MDNVIHVAFPEHFRTATKSIPEHLPNEEEMKAELRGESKPRKKTERETCGGLAWYPRLKIWKACSGKVTFDPESERAYSYSWWRFVDRIGGRLVFNAYRYSSTTTTHQWCVRRYLEEKGIKIDLEVHAPKGLQNLESCVSHYERLICDLRWKIAQKGSRKAKNAERIAEIESLQKKILDVYGLISAQEVSNG